MSQENLKNSEKLPFLLEIGSEEIPARFIPGAMEHFEKTTVKALESNFLSWDSLRIVATPRRMALLVGGLSVRQPDRNVEIKGPPVCRWQSHSRCYWVFKKSRPRYYRVWPRAGQTRRVPFG